MTARLLIDCGNTRLKWSFARDRQLGATRAIVHGGDPAAMIDSIEAEGPESIWIANVTGKERSDRLARRLLAHFRVPATIARVRQDLLGLHVAYANPSRLGVDRWLMLLAAWKLAGGAACVGAAGTALTFDAVDANGQHLGGVIAPGLLAAQQATLGSTRFAAAGPDLAYSTGLGADTEACVRQGAFHACAGLLDRLSARHAPSRCFLTGGDAETLAPQLAQRWELRPQLVLEGLLVLAESA
jgi:type III pantothenate kinase